jgi:hypothetical protein
MEEVKSHLEEELLDSKEVKAASFRPPYPEREFWLRTVDAFELLDRKCFLVSGDMNFGGFEERLENRFEDGGRMAPERIPQAAYDLNEFHIVDENFELSASFTHDRELVFRGPEKRMKLTLQILGDIDGLVRYTQPLGSRDRNLESGKYHEEKPVGELVKRKAEDEDTWISKEVKRPERFQEYFKQRDALMSLLKQSNRSYHVTTHPPSSRDAPPQHVKMSHPSQWYAVPGDVSWAVRLCYDRHLKVFADTQGNLEELAEALEV